MDSLRQRRDATQGNVPEIESIRCDGECKSRAPTALCVIRRITAVDPRAVVLQRFRSGGEANRVGTVLSTSKAADAVRRLLRKVCRGRLSAYAVLREFDFSDVYGCSRPVVNAKAVLSIRANANLPEVIAR